MSAPAASAWRKESATNFSIETQLNAFVTIPYSKITEGVLQQEKVPHTVTGPEIVVHGNESDRFADLLNVETRRTMDKGLLNPSRAGQPGYAAENRGVHGRTGPRIGASCVSRCLPRRLEPKRT